jgi:hypothetical protein
MYLFCHRFLQYVPSNHQTFEWRQWHLVMSVCLVTSVSLTTLFEWIIPFFQFGDYDIPEVTNFFLGEYVLLWKFTLGRTFYMIIFAVIIDMFILNTLVHNACNCFFRYIIINWTIFLPEYLAPFNTLFVLFDDIVGLEENLDCIVLMKHLVRGMNIQFLKRSFLQLQYDHVT